jgi:uncharacterized coiled-coil protein SlyX
MNIAPNQHLAIGKDIEYMSTNPRPESRISSLEHRASTIEAQIIEMSSDTAEELKAIRQDIKQLDEGMMSSFKKIGDTFIDTMATKDDLKPLATKEDLASVKTDLAELKGLIMQLLQKKP